MTIIVVVEGQVLVDQLYTYDHHTSVATKIRRNATFAWTSCGDSQASAAMVNRMREATSRQELLCQSAPSNESGHSAIVVLKPLVEWFGLQPGSVFIIESGSPLVALDDVIERCHPYQYAAGSGVVMLDALLAVNKFGVKEALELVCEYGSRWGCGGRIESF